VLALEPLLLLFLLCPLPLQLLLFPLGYVRPLLLDCLQLLRSRLGLLRDPLAVLKYLVDLFNLVVVAELRVRLLLAAALAVVLVLLRQL
jgi:hypothetical protein